MIKDLPVQERPRERLAEKGASHLSSIELIAILLGTGTRNHSALSLSADLISRFGTLEALADATLEELLLVKGVGLAKAVRLQAAFALWKRLQSPQERTLLDSPEKAFAHLSEIGGEKTEVLALLLRDSRKSLLRKEVIARGTVNKLLVHPREVFSLAVRHLATSVIIAHNHPSGDPTPSTSDLEMTQQLFAAGRVVGIPLVDHLIIAGSKFYSFQSNRLLDTSY